MKRINFATGLLAMAASMPVFALTPALPPEATQPVAAATSAGPALAAVLANDLMLRVSIDTNDAAKSGVPCADFGADSGACATGRLALVNTGQARITGDGWKLYLHSIRRILSINHPDFSLRHLTGDLYELTPRSGAVTLAAGERLEVPFVAEYWLLRYSDVLPRPYVVVAGAAPAVLRQNDTEDESRYVDALPANDNSGAPLTPAQIFRQQAERGEPLPAREVAARVLPSAMRTNVGEGEADLRGVEMSLPDLSPGQVEALRERAGSLGLAKQGLPLTGVIAPHALPADIAVAGGYRVRIAPSGVSIDAFDAAGLYYGVQTVLSLAPAGGGRIPAMTIEDAPRYGHRGMMVDVARNFRQPATLRRLIDQMSAYKLNRLHLHLSDDEGWRIEIPGLPELTAIGARRCHDLGETRCLIPQLASGPDNRSGGGFLTRDEYIALLRYANDRFVEVIPEIDMPGHSRAAVVAMEARYRRLHASGNEQEANAFRLIDPDDTSNTLSVQFYDRRSNLNPCSSGALNFAGKVIGEIAAMHREAQAPLNVWHFGGDEAKNILLGAGFQARDGKDADKGRIDMGAQDKPWARSPMCAALLKQEGIESVDELPSRFARQVSSLVNANGIETMEAWQDGLKHAAGPRDFATKNVMVTLWDTLFWGGAETARSWSAKGYLGILALPDYLYFDFPYTLDPHERGYYWGSRATDSFKTFSLAPDNLPQNAEVMPDREGKPFEVTSNGPAAHVYGMQGQAWAEVIRTDQQFEYMVYPRLLALAERAWHRAEWERPYKEGERYKLGDTDLVDKRALARDWQGFASVVEQRELPKLKLAGIGYRSPKREVAETGIEKRD
ncbi:MAG: carbohydate-binding domain-containing protein [Pseudomonadota bacterium]|nr:carbohydate-binding domain-containing protein [Pseudomonadota bacterium]